MIKKLTGQTFGNWIVLEKTNNDSNNKVQWLCKCKCGNVRKVVSQSLVSGASMSCGCYRKKLMTTHGMSKSTEYCIWRGIKERCLNSNNKKFYNYGGRGIRIYEPWVHSFEDFIKDVGHRPSSEYSLGRIDNNGHYEPQNVRWETMSEQLNNKRDNRIVEFPGHFKITLSQLSKLWNIKRSTLEYRIFIAKWPLTKSMLKKDFRFSK